jgi:hypothetical protein
MIKLKSWLISAWNANVSASPICTSAIFPTPKQARNHAKASKKTRLREQETTQKQQSEREFDDGLFRACS